MRQSMGLTGVFLAGLVCSSTIAQAREYIGFGQEGDPGSLSEQNYLQFAHTAPNTNSIQNFFELSYFTKTGFTGNTRDQFEFWVGSNVGYQTTHGAPGSSGWGISDPEIGIEYYLNVIQPKAPVNSPGYLTFWTSPTFFVNFPNGNPQTAGYGAGANQYSLDLNWDNYLQIGKVDITMNPIEFAYAFRDRNTVPNLSFPGTFIRQRGGLSITVGDFAIAYQFTPDLAVGILHQFNFNNVAGSTIAETREGFIGPSFTYAGFAKQGLFFSGTVQTDYYHSTGLNQTTYVAAWISKEF